MSEWQRLRDEVVSRLAGAEEGNAVAFAAVTAERLMRLDPQQRPFTQGPRPLLDLIWRAVAGDPAAFKPIVVGLGQFYISEFCHNEGQAGPSDADDDPAAAILYTAECYMHALPQFAVLVASRGIDAAHYWVQLATGHRRYDRVNGEAAMAAEARQQLATLAALAPFAQQLSRARTGLPAAESEHLMAQLQQLVIVAEPGSAAADVPDNQAPLW